MTDTTLIRSGIGTKDSNASLAAEFFATLEATHGNSVQAKSLKAMLTRAEGRFAERMARKAARKAEKADEPVISDPIISLAQIVIDNANVDESPDAIRKARLAAKVARERAARLAKIAADNAGAAR